MDNDVNLEDLVVLFVQHLEAKMERFFGILPLNSDCSSKSLNSSDGNFETNPENALLFQGKSVSIISGRSSSLVERGFKPYEEARFNTQFAIKITGVLANLHAFLRVHKIKNLKQINTANGNEGLNLNCRINTDSNSHNTNLIKKYLEPESAENKDWIELVSQSSLVSANLSILCSQFSEVHVSPHIIQKLELLKDDIGTFTEFLQFIATIETKNIVQSLGPICMCDVWIPKTATEEDDAFLIRLRGGPNLHTPPMRDVAWVWLTLIQPQILRDRYVELCECYCSTFNDAIQRLGAPDEVGELTHFDVMRDLSDSFLHGFLTIVHKFTISGVWALDRQLFNKDGVRALGDSVGFLVENGIIGSIFVA